MIYYLQLVPTQKDPSQTKSGNLTPKHRNSNHKADGAEHEKGNLTKN